VIKGLRVDWPISQPHCSLKEALDSVSIGCRRVTVPCWSCVTQLGFNNCLEHLEGCWWLLMACCALGEFAAQTWFERSLPERQLYVGQMITNWLLSPWVLWAALSWWTLEQLVVVQQPRFWSQDELGGLRSVWNRLVYCLSPVLLCGQFQLARLDVRSWYNQIHVMCKLCHGIDWWEGMKVHYKGRWFGLIDKPRTVLAVTSMRLYWNRSVYCLSPILLCGQFQLARLNVRSCPWMVVEWEWCWK
jgi:hypothetical protein